MGTASGGSPVAQEALATEQLGQRHAAESAPDAREEFPAGRGG